VAVSCRIYSQHNQQYANSGSLIAPDHSVCRALYTGTSSFLALQSGKIIDLTNNTKLTVNVCPRVTLLLLKPLCNSLFLKHIASMCRVLVNFSLNPVEN